MENVVKASGQDSHNISMLASDIRSNMEFMDRINEAYTYVQIPLKMSGQNASGELYVYTNKKQLAEGKEDLTAFLHLDMDHLGPTDVSVRMHGRDVDTKFYFDNDETYELVEAHLPELEERLKAKGYHCSITVVNEGKQVNFVEDFLKKDQPSAGLVHRYSFDMRA
jgi:flagellar hook-length control protein FliK